MKFPLAVLFACAAAHAQTLSTIPTEEEWKELHRAASEIRGLEFLRSVGMKVQPFEKYKDGVVLAACFVPGGRKWALKKIGLYAPDVNEHEAILALGEATMPVYYSFATHDATWIDRTGQTERNLRLSGVDMALYLLGTRMELNLGCHELVHALQDQHFTNWLHMEKWGDSDHQAAVNALYEGDATLVQYEYLARVGGKTAKDLLARVSDVMFDSSAWFGSQAIDAAPRSLREDYLFRYTCGTRFALALREHGGWEALNQAYADPPQSSEQILHPEKYYGTREDPVTITLPDFSKLLPECKLVFEEVVGEQSLRVLMRETHPSFLEQVEGRACAGWGGDRYALLAEEGKEPILVWALAWDTEPDALEFFEAYRWTLCHKYQENGAWGDIEEGRKFVGVTRGQGVVVMMRTGKDVLIVEGLETEDATLLASIDANVRKVTPKPR